MYSINVSSTSTIFRTQLYRSTHLTLYLEALETKYTKDGLFYCLITISKNFKNQNWFSDKDKDPESLQK